LHKFYTSMVRVLFFIKNSQWLSLEPACDPYGHLICLSGHWWVCIQHGHLIVDSGEFQWGLSGLHGHLLEWTSVRSRGDSISDTALHPEQGDSVLGRKSMVIISWRSCLDYWHCTTDPLSNKSGQKSMLSHLSCSCPNFHFLVLTTTSGLWCF